MKLTIASSSEVCTHWPRPVRSRAISAASTPCVSSVPAAVSEIAMPTRHGPDARRPGDAHEPAEALRDLVDARAGDA